MHSTQQREREDEGDDRDGQTDRWRDRQFITSDILPCQHECNKNGLYGK